MQKLRHVRLMSMAIACMRFMLSMQRAAPASDPETSAIAQQAAGCSHACSELNLVMRSSRCAATCYERASASVASSTPMPGPFAGGSRRAAVAAPLRHTARHCARCRVVPHGFGKDGEGQQARGLATAPCHLWLARPIPLCRPLLTCATAKNMQGSFNPSKAARAAAASGACCQQLPHTATLPPLPQTHPCSIHNSLHNAVLPHAQHSAQHTQCLWVCLPPLLLSPPVVEGWLDLAKLVASEGSKGKGPYEELAYKIGAPLPLFAPLPPS
jgi:hypothetical protein